MLTVGDVKYDLRFVVGHRVRVKKVLALRCKSDEVRRYCSVKGTITQVYPWVVIVKLDSGRVITVDKKEFFMQSGGARFI